QHQSSPLSSTTQTVLASLLSCTTRPGSVTRSGTVEDAVLPCPSCPTLLAPKHHTLPSVLSAQVCATAVATASQSASKPTRAGRLRSAVSPRPSRPSAPAPQQ